MGNAQIVVMYFAHFTCQRTDFLGVDARETGHQAVAVGKT